MKKGIFITYEGPEGAGKSTVIQNHAEYLKRLGIDPLIIREPGGTLLGEAIRGLLQHNTGGESPCARAELALFEASRAQLVERVIFPALQKKQLILCDRFYDSTTAYQAAGRGFEVEQIERFNLFATNSLNPDLTILLDLPVEIGFERLKKRISEKGIVGGMDRFEKEKFEFHQRIRQGYLEIAKRYPERVIVIDASKKPEEVMHESMNVILGRYLKYF